MVMINQNEYERRREYAGRRAVDNEDILISVHGFSEEDAEILSDLASLRHDFHSNPPIISDERGLKQKLVKINVRLYESELEPMSFVGTDESDFVDIDTINELFDYGQAPDVDDQNYQKWYDGEYVRISNELEALNTHIEEYLKKIDKKYRTNYAPSGAYRV